MSITGRDGYSSPTNSVTEFPSRDVDENVVGIMTL